MKIEYVIFIKDSQTRLKILWEMYSDIEQAVEDHKELMQPDKLRRIVEKDVQDHLGEIDLYYLNNPFKRFEVTLEVLYQ